MTTEARTYAARLDLCWNFIGNEVNEHHHIF
jgi:hypothetical protein